MHALKIVLSKVCLQRHLIKVRGVIVIIIINVCVCVHVRTCGSAWSVASWAVAATWRATRMATSRRRHTRTRWSWAAVGCGTTPGTTMSTVSCRTRPMESSSRLMSTVPANRRKRSMPSTSRLTTCVVASLVGFTLQLWVCWASQRFSHQVISEAASTVQTLRHLWCCTVACFMRQLFAIKRYRLRITDVCHSDFGITWSKTGSIFIFLSLCSVAEPHSCVRQNFMVQMCVELFAFASFWRHLIALYAMHY